MPIGRSVLVFLITLAVRQIVDQSVLSAQSVLRTRHASINAAEIHVRELVETMLDVGLQIIPQYALVLEGTQVIRSHCVFL